MLRKAGKERFDNHIQENFFYLRKFVDEETKTSEYSIKDNKIVFRLNGQREPNPNRLLTAALHSAYYTTYDTKKCPGIKNASFYDVLKFISEFQHLFQGVTIDFSSGITENAAISQVPICVGKKDLASHLHKVSGVKEKVITKVLQILSAEFNESIDFWKTPLISFGVNYYFNIQAISHFNSCYILEQILEHLTERKGLKGVFQQDLREHTFINGLSKEKLPSLVTRPGVAYPKDLQDSLVFELETTFILCEPCIIPFPFNSVEYADVIDRLTETSFLLEKKRKALIDYLPQDIGKPVIRIIVPNFPAVSGLIVNDCFVMDPWLLMNYFSTGEFKRGVAIVGAGTIETKGVSSYRYYENEREMSDRFYDFCLLPDPIK